MKKILLFLLIAPSCWAQLPDLFSCDLDGDGMTEFDLSVQTPILTGGQPGYSVTYYQSLGDAEAQTEAIANFYAFTGYDGQIVFARSNELASGNFTIDTFNLEMSVAPQYAEVTTVGQLSTVEAFPTGIDYEYSLDGGEFQESNIFNNVPSGMHTFVVRDLLGCGELIFNANILGVETNSFKDYFALWPNPFTDVLHISGAEAIDEITISEVSGKSIYLQNSNSKDTSINLVNLSKGLYLVKATVSGRQQTFKIVKQ